MKAALVAVALPDDESAAAREVLDLTAFEAHRLQLRIIPWFMVVQFIVRAIADADAHYEVRVVERAAPAPDAPTAPPLPPQHQQRGRRPRRQPEPAVPLRLAPSEPRVIALMETCTPQLYIGDPLVCVARVAQRWLGRCNAAAAARAGDAVAVRVAFRALLQGADVARCFPDDVAAGIADCGAALPAALLVAAHAELRALEGLVPG